MEEEELTRLLILFSIEPPLNEDAMLNTKKKILLLHPNQNHDHDTTEQYNYYVKEYSKLKHFYYDSLNKTQLEKKTVAPPLDKDQLGAAFMDYARENKLTQSGGMFNYEFNKMFDAIYVKEDDGDTSNEWSKGNGVTHRFEEASEYGSAYDVSNTSDLVSAYTQTNVPSIVEVERYMKSRTNYSYDDYKLARDKQVVAPSEAGKELLRGEYERLEKESMDKTHHQLKYEELMSQRKQSYLARMLSSSK